MDDTHSACEKCIHELSNLVGGVMGYYELMGDDPLMKEKLGMAIERLYKFTLSAGEFHRNILVKKSNETFYENTP